MAGSCRRGQARARQTLYSRARLPSGAGRRRAADSPRCPYAHHLSRDEPQLRELLPNRTVRVTLTSSSCGAPGTSTTKEQRNESNRPAGQRAIVTDPYGTGVDSVAFAEAAPSAGNTEEPAEPRKPRQ